MKLSKFGEKFTNKSGILQLMDDLGKALNGGDILMLGGGNPAHIPEMDLLWRKRFKEMASTSGEVEKTLGDYTTPQGDEDFIKATTSFFQKNHNWNITEKNICVLPGSQTTFFFLLNLLAGQYSDGSFKKVLLPIVPEYIGYEDQGIQQGFFEGITPKIEFKESHTFKYSIDFDAVSKVLEKNHTISAICISRPTNPTGNVISDEELNNLSIIAKEKNIPFIIDNAYGLPFPGVIYTDVKVPQWEDHMIYVMSLSKIGLPSSRTSIVIANESVISALSSVNAIVSLSTGRIGQRVMLPYIQDSSVVDICQKFVTPFYKKRAKEAIKFFHSHMNPKIPYYLHEAEGAYFLWLWCKDLPISSQELYEQLKQKGVLVVPGNYFFFGHNSPEKNECIRISYSSNFENVKKGLEIIAKTLEEIYKI